MILTLFDQNKAFNLVLPERITGRYILSNVDHHGNKIDMMAVEAEDGIWYLKSNKYAFLLNAKNEKAAKAPIEAFKTYTIFRENEPPALLYVEPPTNDRNEYTKHYAITNVIKIGRSKDNHICFSNKIVSGFHCVIEYSGNDHAIIRDLKSSNGTYVNGERIQEKTLSIGDVINIMGLKIIFNGRLLSFNNPHRLVSTDKQAFKPFAAEKPIIEPEEELDDLNLIQKDDNNLFYRSPRFKREITTAEIKIDPPPQESNMEETPLIYMLGPSITMGMASLFMGLLTLQNVMRTHRDIMMAMPTLVMSFSMLIGTVLWPILMKRHEKKKKIEMENLRQKKYKQYLKDMAKTIEKECLHQSEILHENHVTLSDCVSRITMRKRNLWERSIGQNDFLKVRLGLGNLPLNAEIKFPEKKFSVNDDNLMDELYELASTPQILREVPVTLSFEEERISGMIGQRETVKNFVEGLIFQLTSLHSYDECKLVFIYDKSEHEWWKFARWLPHVWDDARDLRFIATDVSEIKVLSSYLEKEISRRSELSDQKLEELTQHYVIFSMDKALADRAEMINLLLKEKKNIRFSLVTLYDELKNLPKECSTVVEMDRELSKIFDKDDTSGQYTAFVPELYVADEAEKLAVKLANIHLDSLNKAFILPEMLTFMEMFGVSKIEHLNALTRWKENNPTKTMETPIGVDPTGELFKIDLHEKYHGPHGLIAGMTGSGKSEFIMTFILSLAVNYHPDEVAFILIDYKGGGMANAFLNLPHLAGTITNLDGAAVNRSLISIQSELKRRQAIFSETSRMVNESNIDIYKYQKLYREGLVKEPLQHLFIISDEFAELKTQQPEFMAQLVSAARIGRSLGVHLILATQKPSGVVDDQIWSNSKFRISLKVQEKADSMEVIKRPDAAELSQTGRFYLQVGFNEVFELGQSAWAGAPYYPSEKVEKRKDENVDVIDTLGRVIKSSKIDKQKNQVKNPPKQIDEITKYLANLASQENIKVKQLWLEPIPELIYLDELRAKYPKSVTRRHELNPVIGEFDDPSSQSQNILRLPLTEEGNAVIYGVSGSGKTTFVASLAYSLMEEHTPEELHLYLLDFSSETLSWFREAPYVGDVVLSHESEKVSNLFKLLNNEIEKRKKLLSNYGGDFSAYNQKAEQGLPSIVVMIHNYSAFSEMYESQEEIISYLTREGLKYGIYFILTAANTGAIRYRLLQNFKQLYVLQLNDTTDYSGVLGNVDGVYPSKCKGRGIFKTNKTYEFQVAHITKDPGDMYTFITKHCGDYHKNWEGNKAKRIPILPEKVDLDYLRPELANLGVNRVPVGVEKNSMRTSFFDFKHAFVNLVLSSNVEQCTGFMQGTAEVLTAAGGSEVIVLDPNHHFVKNSQSTYKYVSTQDELEKEIVYLFETLVYRNNTTKDRIAEGKEKPVFNQIVCMVDSFTDLTQLLSTDGKDKLAVFLDKGDSLNVSIILSESADKLSSITYEPWFKKQVSLSDGIWIGNGITDQYSLKVNKMTNDMYQEIPNDFGYVLAKGKPSLVKLLTSANQEGEVLIYG